MTFVNAFKQLRRRLFESAAVEIVVQRDTATIYEGPAVLASSSFEDVDRTGRRVNVYSVDFIVSGDAFEPEKGDVVTAGGASYIIRPLLNEIWRYDDPYQVTMRIHAQAVHHDHSDDN